MLVTVRPVTASIGRRGFCGHFRAVVLAAVPPTESPHVVNCGSIPKEDSSTHRRYTVRPTAVPISAADTAVETIEPARVRRRFAGGRSVGRKREAERIG